MVDRAPRILLVDDEQSIQTLLSYPAAKDGYEVVQATDGREALARFAERAFDLVVLDVMLPQLDGLEVCRRLRAAQHGADHHAHRQGRGDRQGRSASSSAPTTTSPSRSRMREFRSRVKAALRRAEMTRAERAPTSDEPLEVARAAHRLRQARGRGARRGVRDDLRRVRDPQRAGHAARAACSRATCC